QAYLHEANIQNAFLVSATLSEASLLRANLSGANLADADLQWANLSGANLSGAKLTGCNIYGCSAWNVQLKDAIQSDLVITNTIIPLHYAKALIELNLFPEQQVPQIITVDNLEVAQFIYLLLNNKKIRGVIDAITSKVVLILGRFTPERKVILDAIRDELRKRNYIPVLFDFEKPANRDLTETVSILAHLARFIIVDLTDPSSAPHEVATVIPQTVVPVQPLLSLQPLIVDGKAVERHEYAMFEDLRRRYHWVLPTHQYKNANSLITSLKKNIIDPAERKAQELEKR
ncbi:MAG: pentapeptide repeat-containing protein, partial [Ktedonobacteraceae bacterium]